MKRLLVVAGASLATVLLVACGGGKAESGPQMPVPTAAPEEAPAQQMAQPTTPVPLATLPPTPCPGPPSGSSLIPNQRGGAVAEAGEDQILLDDPHWGKVVLNLSPTTVIWEGAWVSAIPIEPGDHVLASGRCRPEGGFDVEKLWVGAVNLIGPVKDVRQESGGLQFRVCDRYSAPRCHLDKAWQLVVVDPRTKIPGPTGWRPFSSAPVELSEGDRVGVVGRILKDGTVLAVSLYEWYRR